MKKDVETKGQQFRLGDLLSITIGRMLAPSGIDGIYKILNYLTQDNLFTHQLPRACDECRPYILEKYPLLAQVQFDEHTKVEDWMQYEISLYGDNFILEPMPKEYHARVNPLIELETMLRKVAT